MSIHIVEIAQPSVIDTVAVAQPSTVAIVEIRQGPAGTGGGGNSITSATTSDGTANLSLANVTTATAEVTGTLTAPHIHGNLAGSVYAHVRAGEALAKGDPVYVSGSHGSGVDLIAIVSKADASNAAKMPAVGIMDAAVANNANGHMVITGTITELNTAAYSINAELYVATGGGFTATPPSARAQPVARVERANANNGAVLVKVNGLSASDATANTLVRRTSDGSANFQGINAGSIDAGTIEATTLLQTTALASTGNAAFQGSVEFDTTSYTYGEGAAAAHRTALGSGATGDALFQALTPAAARTALELGNLATLNGPLAVASGGTGTTNGSITGTGALTLASAAASNINLTPGTTGLVSISKTSSAGVRESILRATVSDASSTDGFFISNGTSGDGAFAPSFGGISESSAIRWGLQFVGFVSSVNDASDSSGFGLIDLAALRTTSNTDPYNGTLSDVSNRKLLTVRGTSTSASIPLTLHADGSLLVGTTSKTGLTGGGVKVGSTTASTSTTTGALVVSGGVGIAGAVNSLYQRVGSGTPEGVVTAPVGAVYHRTNGGAGTSFYVKESGAGNTGWVAK